MAADLLPDAIITIGLDSNIQYANLAAERLFGFDRGSMVGCSLVDAIIPPEMAAQHERGMKQYMKSRTGPVIGRRIEVVARDRAGRRFPIELAIFPDPATEGRSIHAQIREVSDRVAREAEFRAEREQLAQFLDATTEGWWDCEIGGATRYADRLVALQNEMGREAARRDGCVIAVVRCILNSVDQRALSVRRLMSPSDKRRKKRSRMSSDSNFLVYSQAVLRMISTVS